MSLFDKIGTALEKTAALLGENFDPEKAAKVTNNFLSK